MISIGRLDAPVQQAATLVRAFGTSLRVPLIGALLLSMAVAANAGVSSIGIAKDANVSGREVNIDFYLENFTGDTVAMLSLSDDLDAVFGAGNYIVLSGPTFADNPGTITLDGGFDGSGNPTIISGGSLAAFDTAQIGILVEITTVSDQGFGLGVYQNQVVIMSDEGNDASDDGTDPDPDGDSDPSGPGNDDPTLIDLLANPILGVAKAATLSGNQVTLDFVLENFGNRTVSNLTLPDDLDAVFGAGNYTIVSPPTLIDNPGTITVNGAFDGSGDTALITSGSLVVGDTAQIRVVVDVTTVTDQGAGLGVYSNQVTASGQAPDGAPTSDLSDNGLEPDANGDSDPTDPDEDDPTVFVIGEEPVIGVAKSATVSGSDVTLDFYLENLGNIVLDTLTLSDDLDAVFGAGNYVVTGAPMLVDDPGTISLEAGFDGSGTQALITAGTLAIGDTAQIRLVVRVLALSDQGSGLGVYRNQVTVQATTTAGGVASDLSDDGTDPDPNGNGDPSDPAEDDPTDFTVAEIPVVGVAKRVQVLPVGFATIDVGGTPQNNVGPRVVVTLSLENLGNVALSNITLTDDLNAVFGAGNYGTIVGGAFPEVTLAGGGTIVRNVNYNGSTQMNVLNAGSTMEPGAVATIKFELLVINVVDQGLGLGIYQNQASAMAEGPSGGMTSDLSDAGNLADPNQNGDPTDPGEDDPTQFVIGAFLGAAKTALVSGNQVTFDLYLEAFGGVALADLSLTDDLGLAFGAGNFAIVTPAAFIDDPGTIALNGGFDGEVDTELLGAAGTLAAGDTAQIRFTVRVDTLTNPLGNGLGAYTNQATAQATLPGGVEIIDQSENGTDPDPNGDGDPTGFGENDATPFTIATDAVVGVAKDVAVAGNQVTFDFYLENLGTAISTDLTLTDDLDLALGVGNYTVSSGPAFIVDPGTLVLNGAFDGSGDPELLSAGSTLAAGATAQIQIVVDITTVADVGLGVGVYENQALVRGLDSAGVAVPDLSDFGTDPDPTGDGDPTFPGLADPPVDGEDDPTEFFLGDSGLGAALHSYVQGTQITYDYVLENLGDVVIDEIQATQSLLTPFGFGNFSVVQPPTLVEGDGSLAPNATFDGVFSTSLVFNGVLDPGERARIRFVINVDTVMGGGVYSTQFTAVGFGPFDQLQTDMSDDGIVSDPNGNGNANEAGENDPTLSILGEETALGVAKDVTVAGTVVTFDLYLENFGNVTVSDITLVEDLDAVFGAGNYSITTAPAFVDDPGTMTLDGAWDGSATAGIFSAGSTLALGDTAQVRFVVDVTTITDQGAGLGVYRNQVDVLGSGPTATVAADRSDDGTDPDPNGNSNPADAGETDPTVFVVADPVIGVAKSASVFGRDVTIDVFIGNLGSETLITISVNEDLDAVFGAGNYTIVTPPTLVSAERNLSTNPSFDGSGDTELIAEGSSQDTSESVEQIRFTVRVTTVTDQGFGLGTYQNQVTATAVGAVSTGATMDLSDNGTDPDSNGNDLPGDAGEDDPTPIALRGSIGDRVWNDLDGNGVQDMGEPGLTGVLVFVDSNGNGVLDEGEPSASSGVNGAYVLSNLPAGMHTVRVDASSVPAGFVLTSANEPLAVTLFAGENFELADFGYQQQDASIGDFVWNDLNGDGVQDGGEPGLPGVTVYLDLNGNGVLDGGEPSDTTDGGGAYDITDLPAGAYNVRVDAATVPSGFVLTTANIPLAVTLAAGEDFDGADFGYQQQDASIGDFVWNDLDGDGVQDGGEPGLSGVVVFLDLNTNGVLDGGEPTDTTDGAGAYDITDLPAGTYSVQVDGSTVTTGFVLTGGTVPLAVDLAAGEDFDDADFGYQQQDASIGDFVWNDLNGDGVQDGGEPGLAGVTVFLDLNTNGTLDGGEPTDVTDGAGAYDFTDLATGTYSARVDESTVTTGFVQTGGTNPQVVNLAAGEDFDDADFGYQQQDASIGDFVWNDLNGDGVQDGGEPGLAGVTVFLDLNTNGVLDGGEPLDTTDGSGAYDITDLATGTYSVQVDASTVPAGFVQTGGTNPQVVNLAAGQDFDGADFGYQQQDASIGDFVWNDLNGDGVQDGGEPGLDGITVYLDLNGNGVLEVGEPSDTTAGGGAYDITDLATGTYAVRVDGSTVPAGFVLTGGVNPVVVSLAAGQDFDDADFGYQQQDASIGDFVWNDINGDGVQDGGEPGLAGVTVYLDLNTNGALDTGEPSDDTDASGAYGIDDLAAGTYSVEVDATTLPAGFMLTTANVPLSVDLTAGENFADADFGYRGEADLSITKTDSQDPIAPNATLTYTIEVTNDGPSDAMDVEVTEVLPSEVTFVSTTGCLNDPAGVPVCELGKISVGDTVAFTVEVTVDAGTPTGTISNTVTVATTSFDPDDGNDTASEDTDVDADAPTVTLVDSIAGTGDGELEECEEAKTAISTLLVTFSESVQDPGGDGDADDVTNPANYLLIEAGPDRDFATSVCDTAQGDDIAIGVTGITYDDPSRTASLSLAGSPLADGLYRLLVCGSTSILDVAGNPLDGDGDGTGGDDFVRTYRVDRTNLLSNGHFDCDLDPWTPVSTLPEEIAYSEEDVDASSVSGSAGVTNLSASTDFSLGQCAPIPAGTGCTLVGRARVDAASGVQILVVPVCETFSGPDCSGASLGLSASATLLGDTAGVWQALELSVTSPAGAQSALCSVDMRTASAESFAAFVDDVTLTCGGPIFSDGFESGDTSAWSVTVP